MGKFYVTIAKTGEFSLDAGLVFGAVPKVLWSKYVAIDEYNRVRLGINAVFLDDGDKRILIDSGAGSLDKYNEKLIGIWSLESERVDDAIGLDRNDIDYVVFTHLHFDHAGGSTIKSNDNYEPLFPKAKHYAHEEEIKAALNPHELSRFSYFERDYVPLLKKDIIEPLKGDRGEILKGVSFRLTRGHTEGHIYVKVESEGETLIYTGDLILSKYSVPIAWASGIDLCRIENYYARKELYPEAVEKKYLFAFPHEPSPIIGRISRNEKGKYFFKTV